MSDLLTIAGLCALVAALAVLAWPRCPADRPISASVSITCKRRRFHIGSHRTGPRSKASTAFWRRDSLWVHRWHPVSWFHRRRTLAYARRMKAKR